MSKKLNIEIVKLSDLIPYENNAKEHSQEQIEQIKKSIQEFGFRDPLGINENNIILEGNGRYEALKLLGYKEVEVIRLSHLTEEQKKAYILVHNKLCMNSDFDLDILGEELDFLNDTDINMADYGFDLDLGLDEEEEEEEKPEVLKYNIIFNHEEEYESFLKFLDLLKDKYPELDTVPARLYAYINEYI